MVGSEGRDSVFSRGYPVIPGLVFEKISFSHWITLAALLKIYRIYVGQFLDSLFCPTKLNFSLCANITLSWFLQLYRKSWNQVAVSPELYYTTSMLVWPFRIFAYLYTFLIQFINFYKNTFSLGLLLRLHLIYISFWGEMAS